MLGRILPNMVSQIALGIATGGMSAIMQAAMQIVSQVVQQMISQLGRQLGLPQSAINAANEAFRNASGFNGQNALADATRAFNFTPAQAGQLERAGADFARGFVDQLVRQNAADSKDEDGRSRRATAQTGAAGNGGSWLHMIAEVLGNKLNSLANDMKKGADALNWKDPKQATKFQADIQAFNLVFNTVSSALKTMGEALATAARKQ